MQSVVRTGTIVQGFDVSAADKKKIVLFVADETSKDQSLYLTTPEGTLLKVVSVKAGVGSSRADYRPGAARVQKRKAVLG